MTAILALVSALCAGVSLGSALFLQAVGRGDKAWKGYLLTALALAWATYLAAQVW